MIKVGANYSDQRWVFTVWAPEKKSMLLHLISDQEQTFEMEKNEEGYFQLSLENISPDSRYFYSPDSVGDKYPDPASYYQPQGVHGPSQLVNHQSYQWNEGDWLVPALGKLVFYEIHIGTFSDEGTFDAVIDRLDELAESGINALEIMPVAQFPGNRNWGYDGVYPFAVQDSYGGPEKFKQLVEAAHRKGIAVFLDVVFNHLGPEGNYLNRFGPYFTSTYCIPWGEAVNLDAEWSDGVRTYFSDCILHWYEHYHLDGLRVDAIHMMYDHSAVNFWEMARQQLDRLMLEKGRTFYLIAESDLNSPKVVAAADMGGLGFNAQWLDDFHHTLYVLLDPAGSDRYEDFGRMEQLAKAYTDGFVHSGEYVKFRKRRHGKSSRGLPGDTFVVFNQNHDQIGNRVGGERLSMLVDFETQKIAAAAVLLAPYIPMFFMGEEFGADSPFFYFVSHSEKELIEKVVEGRRKEFENFQWTVDPPNPQDEITFLKSKLKWPDRYSGKYQVMLNWFKALTSLRRTNPALGDFDKNNVRVNLFGARGFVLQRKSSDQQHEVLCIFNLGEEKESVRIAEHYPRWNKLLDSTDVRWNENGQAGRTGGRYQDAVVGGVHIDAGPKSVVVYEAVRKS